MISEKLFKDVMKSYVLYEEWLSKLSSLGIKLDYFTEDSNFRYKFMDLMTYCCGSDIVDYFCNETNFGKLADKYYVTEADGTEYKLHNIDELWDYIKKFNPENVDSNN